jgi:uncharacterized membrane protein YccC
MQSTSKKSWTQETLALKQHLAGPTTGFLTFEKRSMLLLALKTAMAAGLCYWIAQLAGLQDGYWGSISAIIVLQSNVGSTVTASRDRLIGTLIGAGFGAVFSLLGEGLWVYLSAVVAAMVTCSLLGLKNSSRLAGVTVTILLLVHRTGSNWTLPLHRVIEVLLGIVIALGVSTLVFPDRAKVRLRDGLAQEYLLLGAVFQSVLQRLHDEGPETSPHTSSQQDKLFKEAESLIAANGLLLDAARNEPSGGKASLEGLSLLHQFGRALRETLNALDMSVRHPEKHDAAQGGFAGQLEPEVGQLARDIERGFQFMGGCIHRWEFDTAPPGVDLQASTAALEEKIAAVRPTVLNYPQSEILRAYAIHLHLKQVARLLRDSRVDTSETVG